MGTPGRKPLQLPPAPWRWQTSALLWSSWDESWHDLSSTHYAFVYLSRILFGPNQVTPCALPPRRSDPDSSPRLASFAAVPAGIVHKYRLLEHHSSLHARADARSHHHFIRAHSAMSTPSRENHAPSSGLFRTLSAATPRSKSTMRLPGGPAALTHIQ